MSSKKITVRGPYDWKVTVGKGIKLACYYTLPMLAGLLLHFYPEAMSLTVGTLFAMAENYLKNSTK